MKKKECLLRDRESHSGGLWHPPFTYYHSDKTFVICGFKSIQSTLLSFLTNNFFSNSGYLFYTSFSGIVNGMDPGD